MPFDNTPTTTPTLADLSRLLRHPGEWPPGFEWNYSDWNCCADGLARKVWGAKAQPLVPWSIARSVAQGLPDYKMPVTVDEGWANMRRVQPHHVADAIDRYLAAQ